MRIHPTLSRVISKILRGKATPSEIDLFNGWYDEAGSEQLEIRDHKGRTRSQIEEQLLSKIQNHRSDKKAGDRPDSNARGSVIWKVAASVILVIGLVLFGQRLFQDDLPSKEEISFLTFKNGTGMIKKIRLPDGSTVQLFHRTTIQVAENFTEQRFLKLEGEAFFEVKRDSLHPFRVESAHLTTEVLGTSFLIKTLPGQPEVVAVKTGLVKVSDSLEANFMLHPNFRLDYEKQSGAVSEMPSSDPIFAWTEDVLAFQKTGMSEMIQILEDWYGVKITHNLTKKITCEISGSYENQSLENLLQLIQYSIPFTYELNGKNVTLHFKNCP
ncbi:FecR family protein [Algoriphagus terrigena]|uniref:FecR family protein n=1 Tax=Algoriphagus terrigena TaxID=344884 RepID=UPI0003FFAF9F|nr:FecR family protein [Algoriphagus terrigena]